MTTASFIEENASCISSGIQIKESPLGGFGIFSFIDIPKEDVVLTIPSEKVLDIHNLLQLRKILADNDSLGIVDQVLRSVLQLNFEVSETIIIWCHLCALLILRKDPKVDLSHVKWVMSYLDVLLFTEVLDVPPELADLTDALLQEIIETKLGVRKLHEELISIHPPAADYLQFLEAFQLFQAVKSRVLEIPCEIEGIENKKDGKNSEEADLQCDSEGNDDDFTTNVSLVPMLDFANHSFDSNAVFDVDRSTKNIILRLTKPVKANEEITICYSPLTEDMSKRFMNLFLTTYGFLPERGSFLWQIEHFNEVMNGGTGHAEYNDYKKMAQWLRVPLEIAFTVSKSGIVTANLSDSLLPLLLIPGLKYNPDWRSFKNEIYEELCEKAEGSAEDFLEWLSEQEASGDLMYGLNIAYGVLYKGQPIQVDNIVSQTGGLSEEAIDTLELAAMEAIVNSILATVKQETLAIDSKMLKGYYEVKNLILNRYIENLRTLAAQSVA